MACGHGNVIEPGAPPAPCGCSAPLPAESAPIDIRLLVVAVPGLSHAEVANYIRTAIENYSGCLDGGDPRQSIRVVRVQHRGWTDVELR